MLTTPTVASITPNDLLLTDTDAGAANFSVAVTYSEAMTVDGSADPTLTFIPDVAGALALNSGTWSADELTYTATYNVTDTEFDSPDIDIDVSGARDAAGDLQTPASSVDAFDIDMANPTVVSLTPSDLLISDIDVASTFSIDVLFSEPMTDDGSADPTLTFDPMIASTLTLASGTWSVDGQTFTANYNVADANVEVFDIDVTVAAGQDENGNLQVASTFADAFEVDTLELTVAGSAPYLIFNDFATINANDIDFFQYNAHHTGKLIVNAFFDDLQGDLDLEVRDSAGNLIDNSTSTTDDEQIIIPVVSQETYTIQVLGKAPADTNQYDLEIENFAAPAPAFIDLVAASDSGESDSDNITSDTTPTFLVQADLVDFRDMGITLLDQGTIDPNNDGDAADATDDGAGVFVTAVNLTSGAQVEGFANQLGASGFLWSFTPTIPMAPGQYFVSSAVQIVDGQQDPNRENGRAQLSDPLFITILDAAVLANVSADLSATSDSGMFNDDNVTNIRANAFQGIAPAGSTVRIYASGLLVGQTTTGSETSDVGTGAIGGIGGANNDGLGLWEITTEPLVDGAYDITVEVEDAAGTVTTVNVDLDGDDTTTVDLVVDGLAPNTPVLDLQDDTGENLADEITNVAMPNVFMTTTDPNIALAQTLFTDNLKFRIYDRFESTAETLIYDSAADALADNTMTASDMFTSLNALTRTLNLADGTHNLKLEVEDRAGNISEDFLLEVFVDTAAPDAVAPNLLASSDSGMFNDDNVTNKWQPAFDGVAEINNKVFVYATLVLDASGNAVVGASPVLVGSGLVGSEQSNNDNADGLGAWEVTVEPMVDGVYDISVRFEDWAGNFTPVADANANTLRIVIDKEAPNTPFLDLLDDTGRHDHDNITKDNQPQVFMTTIDPNAALAEALFTDNFKFRIYDRFESTAEVLIYDSANDVVADNLSTAGDMFTSETALTRLLPSAIGTLADGVHNLKLEVEDRAGNISHDFLLDVTIDTVAPPISFGQPAILTDGLHADSDTGVPADTATLTDRITSDSTPQLWGLAEADSVVQVYLDLNGDGNIDLGTDILLGQTVATPFDGNLAFANGYWELTSAIDLNDPLLILPTLAQDGLRSLLVTAQDVAGNPMPTADVLADAEQLDIFLDTQGPQVNDVHISGNETYDLFDPKPSVNGFTPLINSIDIDFIDQPVRGEAGMMVGSGFIDVIVVMDESGSMSGEQAFIGPFIQTLDAALVAAGVGAGADTNQYGLVGYGNDIAGSNNGRSLMVGAGLFGSDDEFNTATAGLVINGGTEDGYAGVDFALDNYTFRAGSTRVIVLVTDEDRDNEVPALTSATFVADLMADDAALVSIVDANLRTAAAEVALALDSMTNAYVEQAGGTFTVSAGGSASGGDGVTVTDYIDTAFLVDGFAADLKQLRNGGNSAASFSSALLEGILGIAGASGGFLYPAVNEQIATISSRYQLVGDHVGPIAISADMVEFIDETVAGDIGRTTVRLNFNAPLPDDRYTLTILDSLTDDPGNHLDGESNADEPQETPTFPSGDGVPGADFVARFTVDSRPEIGSYVAQNINIDANGNFVWDPANAQIGNDATNVDLTFTMDVRNGAGAILPGQYGLHDLVFAGKFTNGNAPDSGNLFDQLAVFGWSSELGGKRWLIDTDSDGVINLGDNDGVIEAGEDILTIQPELNNFNVAGALPVAGNFDGNAANGDEIGLYFAGQWAFDTNRDFIISAGEVIGNNGLFGHPVIGDFDGDGLDDAAVFNNNLLTFDLALNGFNGADTTIDWGFPGVLDRPVATDMDQDGIDDIGLWVPRNSAQSNRPIAEWYFLLSNGAAAVPGTVNTLNHPFTPVPFGADLYAEFGDELALPIVGNFDPPVTIGDVDTDPTGGNEAATGDFDQDGDMDGSDFLAWQRGYTMDGAPVMADGDGNADGNVDQSDMQLWAGAYQAAVAATSDFNNDGSVDGGDLSMWQSNFAAASSDGDSTGDGLVSGADFLRWQRSVQTTSIAVIAALQDDGPSAQVAVAVGPSSAELASVASAYRAQYAPAAREAAFEALDEAYAFDFAGQATHLPAASLALAASSGSETSIARADAVAEALEFELDDDSSLGDLF